MAETWRCKGKLGLGLLLTSHLVPPKELAVTELQPNTL